MRFPKQLVTLRGAIDTTKDIVIQPVAVSYAVVPEDLPLSSRKSSRSWIRGMGFFKTLLRFPLHPKSFLFRSLENIYGRAFVSFPKPILLSELKAKHKEDKSGINIDQYVTLYAINEIARLKKIMTTQVVARGIVRTRKYSDIDLLEAVAAELEEIRTYHQQAFNTLPDEEDFIKHRAISEIVNDGLSHLKRRGVLKRFRKDAAGIPLVANELALSYYATHGDRRIYSPTADQNIVIVGAGNWGFALTHLIGSRILDDKNYRNASITLYESNADIAFFMDINRYGPGHFSQKRLPKNVFVTNDPSSAFRKASEVIIASKPKNFEAYTNTIFKYSEQPIRFIISTRGFIPEQHALSYHTAIKLAKAYGRNDVDIYALAGAAYPDDLVENKKMVGILAGPKSHLDTLADLFNYHNVTLYLSNDPIGVQVADTLARAYAVWINYIRYSDTNKNSSEIGYLIAEIAEEARSLALSLGGHIDTFNSGSIPWTATYTSVWLSGPWHDFGLKLARSTKKGKKVPKMFNQLANQWAEQGRKLQALNDLKEARLCAKKLGIKLPILEEIIKTFWE